jgi:hypothetical protein
MATLERMKAAIIRRDGYPIGQPAPCFLRCCDNEIDAPEIGSGGQVTCPTCGTSYNESGWVVPTFQLQEQTTTVTYTGAGELCICVPSTNTIIDMVRSDGRSGVYGETLEEVRKRYPLAEVRPLSEYCAAKAASQDTPITWTETTRERFDEMLGCVPPAIMARGGFLVGEASDHHATTGRPRYAAFVKVGEHYFEASRPMTVAEFRSVALPVFQK